MKLRRYYNFLLILILFEFSGCSSDPEHKSTDFEYVPLTKGYYQIFDVHEKHYSVANDPEELDYELKLVVVDSFLNVSNRYTYVIYRYTRNDDSQPWSYLDTWSSRKESNKIIVSEQTVDFIKLLVPVSTGSSWDGNAYNSMDNENYEVEYRGKSQVIGNQTFDDCIKVVQSNLDDIIVMTDLRSEIYSRDVGLVYREEIVLNFCTTGCNGFGEIESGIEYRQTIKSFGIE